MSETFLALWISIVRTIVPIAVGAVLGWLTAANIPVDPDFEGTLTTLLTAVLTTAYYVAVRLFETYISPKFGWLLGSSKSPGSYSNQKSASRDEVPRLPDNSDLNEIKETETYRTD